jgi:gamma-glutamylcyclotransferase (GGCT)/AIG2-like uncharacterized protein YtfP
LTNAPGGRLFVYGSLRRGGANDIAGLAPAARLLSSARVRGRLYDLGAYPALVLDPGAAWVTGEVYAVPRRAWPALDGLEELVTPTRPGGQYFRVDALARGPREETLACQVYVANPGALVLSARIPGGDWLAHAGANADGRRAG